MERAVYDWMSVAEENLWWYRANHANMLLALLRNPIPPDTPVLDAGSGTGGLLRKLAAAYPDRLLFGIDADEAAAQIARIKSPARLVVGNVNELPFEDECFGVICSVDVLCHELANPSASLNEAMRCLVPGGVIMLNLPAYQWLYSAHDRGAHTTRRFTLKSARSMLEEAGFAQVDATYWNTFLFPLMVLQRKFASKETTDFPAFLNVLFTMVTQAEHWLLRLGLRYPFGGSVLIVGRKPVRQRGSSSAR